MIFPHLFVDLISFLKVELGLHWIPDVEQITHSIICYLETSLTFERPTQLHQDEMLNFAFVNVSVKGFAPRYTSQSRMGYEIVFEYIH